METRRYFLYAIMAFILYSLWSAWQEEHPKTVSVSQQNTQTPELIKAKNALLPDVGELSTEQNSTLSQSNATSPTEATPEQTGVTAGASIVHVKTDVFSVDIDTKDGDIVKVDLLHYPINVNEPSVPTEILTNEASHKYTANSNLLEKTAQGVQSVNFNFHADAQQYEITDDQDRINVVLSGSLPNGLQVKKTFVFSRNNYLIDVRYDVANQGDSLWVAYLNTLIWRAAPDEDKSSMFHIGSYTGASYGNPGVTRYKKVNFSDMAKGNLNLVVKGGWIAMQQHYFLSAWIPNSETKNTVYSRAGGNEFVIGMLSVPLIVRSGELQSIQSSLYVGPEETSVLSAISPGLDLTIDYGWLWFLSSFLFTLMKGIYDVVGNWGWSIVLVTFLVKLVFYRLSASSYRSMAGMRQLQPKLQALRERLGDDKAKLSQATMELYRQEKINPLGGCLPIVVQIPVFIALYWVLLESVELRQAPFIFWIKDLSAADPYHVLPVIMGITMLIQQRLNPAPPDPMQARIMMCLPILFTGLFWSFPAGLVLYWVVNNSLSILQQWVITKRYGDEKASPKKIKPPKK